MTKRWITLGLLLSLIFTLNGCGNSTQLVDKKPASSFSDSSNESAEPTEKIKSSEPMQTEKPDIPAKEEIESVETPVIAENVTVTTVPDTPKPDEPKKNEYEIPKQPEKPQSTEKVTSPKEDKPTETQPPEPESPKPPQEVQSDFDITEWVEFTKSYAQSIGLTLDSTATECWDNPITANPSRTNLKDDIMSRLNRYKNTEGFTAVWVWMEKVSDTEYELYIGYA